MHSSASSLLCSGPDDLLVLNDSRVIPARLYAQRTVVRDRQAPSGLVEVLLTEPVANHTWRALVKPGKKVGVGERLVFPASSGEVVLEAEVLERGAFGERTVRFAPVQDFFAALERIGHMPLPPYIRRDDAEVDRERYQTVFARERGSVAAPTAGLHFTPEMLEAIGASGVEVARVTLHVGLGTFAPLRVENVDEVRLHRENYTLPATTAEAVNRARREGRRVVAVGTTVVRTLEAAAQIAGDGPLVEHTRHNGHLHFTGFSLRSGGRIVDQLSPAPIEPVDAGERLCRPGARFGCIPPCRPDGLPLFQLWGLYVRGAGAGRLREVTPGMGRSKGPALR